MAVADIYTGLLDVISIVKESGIPVIAGTGFTYTLSATLCWFLISIIKYYVH